MIQLTNSVPLTVEPGDSVTFDTVIHHCGKDTCHRRNSGLVNLNASCARYNADFSTVVTTTAAGVASLAIALDGETLNETIMSATIAAAGDLATVGRGTTVNTSRRGNGTITVRNIGTTTVTLTNPDLKVGRWS